jgi:HK97 gp10 family phage protein
MAASDGIYFEVEGLQEINRALYRYSQALGDKVVLQSLREGAKVIQKQARANAPKRTGKLRRNIVIRNSKIYSIRRFDNKLGVYITISQKKKADNPLNAFYGRFIEDGWNVRGACQAGTVDWGSGKSCKGTGRRGRHKTRQAKRTTLKGIRDIDGKKFMDKAYRSRRNNAVNVAIRAAQIGSDIVARKTGLR